MMRNLCVLFILLAAIGGYTLYSDYKSKPPASMEAGDLKAAADGLAAAPDFSFKDIKGRTYSLSGFKGKAVVLNFWASWCAPCVVEFPQMLDLAAQTKEKAVFIFLSADNDAGDMERFIKKLGKAAHQENVFIGLDRDMAISQKLYQTYKLPETYLLSPGLLIKEKVIGFTEPWNSPSMKQKIDSL